MAGMASPRWSGLLLLVAVGAAVAAAGARPRPPRQHAAARTLRDGDESYRLPQTVSPSHYELLLTPNLVSLSFQGHVDITMTASELTPHLVLHADGLHIQACTLNGVALAAPTADLERQFITFDLSAAKTPMRPGVEYVLSCEYSGTIRTDDKGFYRSSYKEDGKDKLLGVTQFEMTFARRAFPAFDEPGFRATFTLSIKHLKQLRAVSNTRPSVISVTDLVGGRVTTTFEKTPRMACYTLAWLLSEMPAVDDKDAAFRTFAPPAVLAEVATSQSLGPQVLALMGRYTGIPYALDKMDQVAVPDFNFGAMENWGLVTYRQAMLLDQASSRTLTNLTVATTIAHELAHQWFGNLVTPSWWSHVWLSEAFAELFCYLMVDQVHPDWKVMDKMSVMEMQDVFLEDALASANPMNHEVYTPDEILDNFGSVTYAKGSSVLRMLRQYLGEEVFRTGLQYYLIDMLTTGSVEPSDLWKGLAKAVAESGTMPSVDIATVGFTWTDLPGYPVVSVAVDADGQVAFDQTRFYSRGDSSSQTWQVPVVWRAAGGAAPFSFMLGTQHDVAPDKVPGAAWVLANVDQIGYFRVNYELSNWHALADALAASADTFSVAERAMLVDDALNLARAGQLDYAAALRLVAYLPGERHFAPWWSFEADVDYLAMHFRAAGGDDQAAFDKWVQTLVHAPYDALGLTSASTDTFEDKLARTVVARLAVEAAFPTAVDEAISAYMNYPGTPLEPDTLRLVFCQRLKDTTSAMYPPEQTFDALLQKLIDSDDEAERQDLTYALGCAPQTDEFPLKKKLLNKMLEQSSGITLRDWRALWKSVSSTGTGLTLALDIASSEYNIIEKWFGADEVLTVFSTLAERVVTDDDFKKLSAFGDLLPQSPKEALATAQDNLNWRAKHYDEVTAYIKTLPTPLPPSPTTPSSASTTPSSASTTPATGPTTPASSPTTPATGPTTPATGPTTPATRPTTPSSGSTTPSSSSSATPPVSTPTPAPPAPTPNPASYRLLDNLVPSLYELILTPNVADKTFSGLAAMEFTARNTDDVDTIVLHASGLQFTAADVNVTWSSNPDADTPNKIPIASVKFDEAVEQVCITLGEEMTPETVAYTVSIAYTGTLRDDLTGLYVSDFGTGKLVGTQLYPAYARRVMPCLDEPKYRASMYLSVIHAADQVAIASTPAIDEPIPVDDDGDLVMDAFLPTDAIAASQLSLVVADATLLVRGPAGDDGATSFVTVHGLQAVVDKATQTGGTLDTASSVLDWFASATGTKGTVPHVSLVGLDNSLDDGAASWGLIALRSSGLADLDNSSSSGESEQTWMTQLGGYLSQLWFGNLVGVEWWDGAWLQQGFATYYQYAVVDSLQSHWQMDAQLYTRAVAPALHADALAGTRALGAPVVGSQESIAEALDGVSKGKGAAVVQMLQHVLEKDDAFDAGLQNYFANNQLAAATEDTLYTAMTAAAQQHAASTPLPAVGLAEVFKSWVDAAGYPVLTAIRDYENDKATIVQERFKLSETGATDAAWWVPVSYALKSEYLSYANTPKVPVKAWLGPGETLAVDLVDTVNHDANKQWLLVNADRRDYYRVNYDVKNWQLIKAFLKEFHTLVAPVARAALVDDALALARAARLDYTFALDLVDYLRLDSDLAPWEAARAAFDYLDAQFLESRHAAVYKTWLLQLLDTAFQEAGFQPQDRDTHTQRLVRAVVTAWACDAGHAYCRKYAAADFAKWQQDADSVGHDTLAATVCEGVRGAASASAVVAKLVAEPEDSHRAALVQGLGCAAATAVLDLATKADSGLRKGEAALLYKAASRFGPSSVTKALAHYEANVAKLVQAFGQGAAVDVFTILANRATTADQVAMLQKAASALGSSERVLSHVALAQANVQWAADNLDAAADVLYALTNTPDPDLPTTPYTGTTTKPTTPVAPTTKPPGPGPTTKPPGPGPTTKPPGPGPTTPQPKPTEVPASAGGLASSGLLVATVLVAAALGARL